MKKYFILCALVCAPLFSSEEALSFEEPIPTKAQETIEMENTAIKIVLGLVFLLIAIAVAFWVIRKMAGSRANSLNHLKSIKVLEKRPISPKSMLYLIEIAGRQVLISESQLEVRTVSKLEWLQDPSD